MEGNEGSSKDQYSDKIGILLSNLHADLLNQEEEYRCRRLERYKEIREMVFRFDYIFDLIKKEESS